MRSIVRMPDVAVGVRSKGLDVKLASRRDDACRDLSSSSSESISTCMHQIRGRFYQSPLSKRETDLLATRRRLMGLEAMLAISTDSSDDTSSRYVGPALC